MHNNNCNAQGICESQLPGAPTQVQIDPVNSSIQGSPIFNGLPINDNLAQTMVKGRMRLDEIDLKAYHTAEQSIINERLAEEKIRFLEDLKLKNQTRSFSVMKDSEKNDQLCLKYTDSKNRNILTGAICSASDIRMIKLVSHFKSNVYYAYKVAWGDKGDYFTILEGNMCPEILEDELCWAGIPIICKDNIRKQVSLLVYDYLIRQCTQEVVIPFTIGWTPIDVNGSLQWHFTQPEETLTMREVMRK